MSFFGKLLQSDVFSCGHGSSDLDLERLVSYEDKLRIVFFSLGHYLSSNLLSYARIGAVRGDL